MKKAMAGRMAIEQAVIGQAANCVCHLLPVLQIMLTDFQSEMGNLPEHSLKMMVFILSILLIPFLFYMNTQK